ncbi:MAG: aldehyde dehydrogenase family protein [Verrucomicrobiota bacterium]
MEGQTARLAIPKTYKLFIGGKFPRSESGRYFVVTEPEGNHLAHVCSASRKDFRDAITASENALPAWASASAFLRGQILYRMAEMMESRRESFLALHQRLGTSAGDAQAEVEVAIDRLIYFAGWSDKFIPSFSGKNPVAGPFHNHSHFEPTGVVVALAPSEPALTGMTSLVASTLVGGNTLTLICPPEVGLLALDLAEAIAVSDLPAGALNILTGDPSELAPTIADHRAVDAVLQGAQDPEITPILQGGSAANLKRVHTLPPHSSWWLSSKAESPEQILLTQELKTLWHPSSSR